MHRAELEALLEAGNGAALAARFAGSGYAFGTADSAARSAQVRTG